MWARLRGFSEVISGNMGWGGSLLEAQLRDLLSAWDSFLAGDFCRNTEATGEVSADAWSRAEGRLPPEPSLMKLSTIRRRQTLHTPPEAGPCSVRGT